MLMMWGYDKMQALYTMIFDDFLTQYEASAEWQKVKTIFDQFPAFQSGDNAIDVYTLFVERFRLREIGAETPSIFIHYCEDRARELFVKFSWKLQQFNEQYTQLMGRSTTLEGGGTDEIYLFPVNSSAQRLASKTSFTRQNAGQIAGNLSNPELLTLVMNLRDIYIDVVRECEPLFMGIM